MLIDYVEKISKTEKELLYIKNKITKMQNGKRAFFKLTDINIYKSYAIILAYGCIEHITKNLIADYYKQSHMPLRCQQFAYMLLNDNHPLSVNKEKFNNFLKKECGTQWIGELKRRESEKIKDKKCHKYTIDQLYLAIDFIFAERCKFAHGESSYTGTINELIENFKLAKVWLYEIDDIISSKKFIG